MSQWYREGTPTAHEVRAALLSAPVGQVVHTCAATRLNCPALHARHVEDPVAPTVFENVPT